MASATPITDAERDRILELHAAGTSRNDIVRETGRSSGAVTKVVQAAGLSFDRTATVAATQAKQKDAAARRADAQLAELEILELQQTTVLGVLKGNRTYKALVKGAMGVEEIQSLDFIPGDQLQRLANSRSSSTTIITNLARMDQDNGQSVARSLIGDLAAAFGLQPADTDG